MENHQVLERLGAANPVPGIEHVAKDEYERFVSYFEARRTAMIDAPDSRSETVAAQPKGRLRPVLVFAMVLVAVVLAVGGSVLWIGGGTAEDPASEFTAPVADMVPTITFDGETASYSGPATFDENTLTFRLVNTSDSVRIDFGWYLMNDETMTLDEVIAFAERQRGTLYGIPPWVDGWGGIDFAVPPNTVVEESSPEKIPTGKCLLFAHSKSEVVLYPASFITVSGS